MNPAARVASARWTRRRSPESVASLQGVSSLKTRTGTRRRLAHARARMVAGPYSQLTTQPGVVRDSAGPMSRASVTGARPARVRCHARSTSLE
jgi:hypothetical protein